MTSVPGLLAGLLVVSATAGPVPEGAHHVDAGFKVDGEVLAGRFQDVDGDGARELVLAVRRHEAGDRQLRIHRFRADGMLDPVAATSIRILDDVVAWACADVRADPGREFVFLTRTGAYSFSPTRSGYKGNIERLIEAPIFYDVPDPDGLPEWRYVIPRAGGDALLLPGPTGYAVWAPDEDGSYTIECDRLEDDPEAIEDEGRRGGRRDHDDGERGFSIGRGKPGVQEDFSRFAWMPFLSASNSMHSPALVDFDGDGLVDLVRRKSRQLHIHRATAEGIPDEATRVERYPELLRDSSTDEDLSFHDLDGDGDLDVLVRLRKERDGPLQSETEFRFLVMRNDGESVLTEKPLQVLSFEGADVRASVTDVDGDGLLDLVVSKVGAPDLLELASADGLDFTRSTLAYFGTGDCRFTRTPTLDPHPMRFGEESLDEAISKRMLSHDCDGDGIADLVDVDLRGRVAIYRVLFESGFFSGDTWTLEKVPSRRFDVDASLRNLAVDDLNGDGLGDIFSHRDEHITLLLSRRRGDR